MDNCFIVSVRLRVFGFTVRLIFSFAMEQEHGYLSMIEYLELVGDNWFPKDSISGNATKSF